MKETRDGLPRLTELRAANTSPMGGYINGRFYPPGARRVDSKAAVPDELAEFDAKLLELAAKVRRV